MIGCLFQILMMTASGSDKKGGASGDHHDNSKSPGGMAEVDSNGQTLHPAVTGQGGNPKTHQNGTFHGNVLQDVSTENIHILPDSLPINGDNNALNKVSPVSSRPATANSMARKSAWERAQEHYEAQAKESRRKGTKVKPFKLDEEELVSQNFTCDKRTIAKIFRSKKFKTPKLERLYQRYFFKLNQTNLTVLMALVCIVSVLLILFYYIGGATVPARGVTLGVFVILFIAMEILCNRGAFNQIQLVVMCYVIVSLLLIMVILISVDSDPRSASNGVWCTVFFIYMVYSLLPVRMRLAVGTGLLLSVIHIACAVAVNHSDSFAWKQVGSMKTECLFFTGAFSFSLLCS